MKALFMIIEALILEYKTRPLPKTGYKYRRNIYDKLQEKNPIIPRQIIKYHFTYIK